MAGRDTNTIDLPCGVILPFRGLDGFDYATGVINCFWRSAGLLCYLDEFRFRLVVV